MFCPEVITKTSELLLELTEATFDVKAETIQFSDTDRVNCKIRADKDAFHPVIFDEHTKRMGIFGKMYGALFCSGSLQLTTPAALIGQ